jgi:hypothetical protein
MKLKQSKVILFEEGDIRKYLNAKGEELIGVTSLMKKHGLSADYDGIPEAILKKAAERGTEIHRDCDNGWAFDDYDTPDGRVYGDLLKEKGIEIVASEYLVSDDKMVATKIDNVFLYENKLYVGDLKRTQKLHTEPLRWQLSIGKYLFEKMNKINVDGLAAFWFNKGKCEFIPMEPIAPEEVEKLFECERMGVMYEQPKIELPEQTTKAIEQVKNIEQFIIQAEEEIKRLKEQREQYTAIIEESFTSSGIKSWETDSLRVTLVAPTTVKTFDSKKFVEEHPEIAKDYYKESEKRGYLKITLKK